MLPRMLQDRGWSTVGIRQPVAGDRRDPEHSTPTHERSGAPLGRYPGAAQPPPAAPGLLCRPVPPSLRAGRLRATRIPRTLPHHTTSVEPIQDAPLLPLCRPILLPLRVTCHLVMVRVKVRVRVRVRLTLTVTLTVNLT